jgi:4-alpha-glucanotransferase
MTTANVFHALGLHMHQPPGNLRLLLDANPWEAEQIIHCYERPARYARQYADVAHLHIGFSGILLEQLRDQRIVDRYRHLIDIPKMLDAYRDAANVELIGMGYFHPIFPLIPIADWEEQLRTGRELMQEVFGRAPRGFWPPEMAFSMEMIPSLVKAGYEYVVVDGVHVHPEDGVNDVFRPYLACYDGTCITVVPRDRDVSNAPESGLDATWFAHEVTHRCRFSVRPDEDRLVTTWSDGENGGWFRQMHEGSGFFGHYFSPYMEHVRGGEYPVVPVGISDYLLDHAPSAHAQVQTGAWNVGSTSGFDLSQWAGSGAQQAAADRVRELSRRWWALAGSETRLDPAVGPRLAEARRLVLESETSCYLFWGDDWLPKLYAITDAAGGLLDELETRQQAADPPAVITPAAVLTTATSDAGVPGQAPTTARQDVGSDTTAGVNGAAAGTDKNKPKKPKS